MGKRKHGKHVSEEINPDPRYGLIKRAKTEETTAQPINCEIDSAKKLQSLLCFRQDGSPELILSLCSAQAAGSILIVS